MKRLALLLILGAYVVETSLCAQETQTPERVVASSFGFNENDATDCLQRAIDSGAKTVVVDKRSTPWNVRPIELRDELELVLEEGVEIVAKQGEFRGKGETLFRANRVSNLTIRGEGKGATLRMRKKEYWKAPYELSEWRHGLSLLSSSNVLVENLTIKETGGDGVYVGVGARGVSCRDVTIRNVVCEANNRQGISVISVDGLLIEDCVLCGTVGTPPAAGIDFEPNMPEEQITNVVMRRVLAIDNAGDGFVFYLPNLTEHGKKLSFSMVDCQAVRNAGVGFGITVANGENRTLQGKCVLENVDIVGNRQGIAVRSKWFDGAPLIFNNVRIIVPNAFKQLGYDCYRDYKFDEVNTEEKFESWLETTTDLGISLIAVGTDVDPNGGIIFNDVEIVDVAKNAERDSLFVVRDASSDGVGFKGLSGKICQKYLELGEEIKARRIVLKIDDENVLKMFPALSARRVEPFDLSSLLNSSNSTGVELGEAWNKRVNSKDSSRSGLYARGRSSYYFYANEGESVEWTLIQRRIGNYPLNDVALKLTTPQGKSIELESKKGGLEPKKYAYSAPATGWFQLEADFGASSLELKDETVPILAAARPNLNLIGATGKFSFYVPKDAKDWGVRIVGSAAEPVTATLFDPSGAQVKRTENITALESWSSEIDEQTDEPCKPEPGFWTIQFERPTIGVLEDYVITILGVPALLR